MCDLRDSSFIAKQKPVQIMNTGFSNVLTPALQKGRSFGERQRPRGLLWSLAVTSGAGLWARCTEVGRSSVEASEDASVKARMDIYQDTNSI